MGSDFDQRLGRYGELAVRVGVNLQPGQRLVIRSPVEAASLTRRIAEQAYKVGASFVDVTWRDDHVLLARYLHSDEDNLDAYSDWRADSAMEGAERGDALISVVAEDPALFADVDPARIARVLKVGREHLMPFTRLTMAHAFRWCVVSSAVPAWAARVFPGDTDTAEERLWDEIFKMVRVDQPGHIEAFERHIDVLAERRKYLTEASFRELHFRGPGTDLTVGLPEGHLWCGGAVFASDGVRSVPNLPTEEVFTSPHRERVNGILRARRPLAYNGQLIEDIELTFKGGKIINAKASRGDEALNKIIDTDDGARRLGEVALVPCSSPIHRSGLLFYNTLFDENAASHLALGSSYRTTIEGGRSMTDEEATRAGLNSSLQHVDFMIGSPEMDLCGISKNGSREPLMRSGEWVE